MCEGDREREGWGQTDREEERERQTDSNKKTERRETDNDVFVPRTPPSFFGV